MHTHLGIAFTVTPMPYLLEFKFVLLRCCEQGLARCLDTVVATDEHTCLQQRERTVRHADDGDNNAPDSTTSLPSTNIP